MSSAEINPIQRINELYWGFAISRAIHVAAKLGIADYVGETGIHVKEIANSLSVNEDRLYRLMRLLASYEIFQETDKCVFTATAFSDAISTTGDFSVRNAAHMVTKSMWEAYGHLEHSVRTGDDAYTDLFGKGVFEYLDEQTEENDQFARAMHNYAELENPVIAECCPVSEVQSLVDVGGGQGGFLKALLSHNEYLHGMLFDQPHIIDQATHIDEKSAMNLRFERVGGSFFESVPTGADAYILKRILHDWSDEDCCRILQTIKEAMKPGSKLYVIDAIVPEGNVPHFSKDLEAFLMTWGGQERDKAEFVNLFDKVGLELKSVIETPTPLSVLEVVQAM
ncbi:MAG: hypothetical protein JXR18_07610 [Neptuniibacter sp.]